MIGRSNKMVDLFKMFVLFKTCFLKRNLYSIPKKSVHFLMLNILKISRRFFCKFGMVSPKYTIHRSNIKHIPCCAEIFYLYGNTQYSLICTCSPRRKYMSQEMCVDIILIPTTKGKTHLISQRLSLNMPRLNQNQRIQALKMLARGDVSNVSRAFGCHGNTFPANRWGGRSP